MRLFSKNRQRRLKNSALTCLIAASLWSFPGSAEDKLPLMEDSLKPVSSSWDIEKSEERSVRLNYVSAPWSKVLHQLANDSGSTLVMHDIPPGKFTRHDWKKHSRKDAVQILNRDLETNGFRILIKDQFLTVMESRRTRPEYQRPVAPQAPLTQAVGAATPTAEHGKLSNIVHSELKREQWQQQQEPRKITPAGFPRANPLQSSSIQKTAFQQTPIDANQISTLTVTPANRPALDIARQIHKAFKTRSQLENSGPHGLPGFIVNHAQNEEKAGEIQFLIEIDTSGNQLFITADAKVQGGLKALIGQIDVNPLGGAELPTLVAGDGTKAEIGRQLQKPLKLINQAQQKTQRLEDANQPMNAAAVQLFGPDAIPQGDVNNAQPPSAQPSQPAVPEAIGDPTGLTPEMVGNLKGNVTIEAIDDLDLLIITGNTSDVESVLQVINQIEKMALGSLPEIHLLKLQNVDSQSLAALLNDVYEQLAELRTENAQQNAAAVNVVPVVTPNAVLILAPGSTMEAILQLATELDQPVDPSHEVQLVRLRHAIATSVVTMLEEFYETQIGLGTRLKVAADARTNSIIVQAKPRDLTEILAFIKKIDSDEAASVNQMKFFKLKSALADELATFLNSAIQSVSNPSASTVGQNQTGQGQAQNQTDPKSVVLEFLAEDGQQLARSGLLNDIRFNAETRTNSLAVTAPSQSMPLIEELIRILDRPSTAVADVKYFKLQNADALDAVELLTSLFTEETNTNASNNESSAGIQLVGATDTSSALLPLKFVADARTNSVVATGGADALIIVENLLYRLDATDPRTRKTRVVKLRNAPAADVADAINTFLQSQRDLATIDPDRISTSQLLDQEVIVTPEPISNNLLISATPNYFADIEALAKELDAEPAQVVIQALLVEVALTNNDEFGVELGFQDPVLFDRSLIDNIQTVTQTMYNSLGNPTVTNTSIVSQEGTPGFNFNNNPLGSNNNRTLTSPATVGSQGLSSFALGRTNSDLGYGGLVLSASSESVNVLIRALAARRSVRILSRPQIRALDNQLAQIQVGQIVPVTDGVTQTQTAVTPQIVRDPAGIILTVTPRISPEGQIVMEVVAEKSNYTDEGVVVYTDVATGAVVTSPVKNISTAQTTVKVPDGQTIVLGGMITDTNDKSERKVPWLGDLPLIGQAFRYDSEATERTELLIFLTPRIVHHDAVSEQIKQVEANRIHFFQEEAEEIHGPLFGVPNETGMYLPGETYDGVPLHVPPVEVIVPQRVQEIQSMPPAPLPLNN